ncbi:MAG: hypothetical protein DRQ55_02990 [Planctomycetota bacterium]|nr:MAG: hypothetical protein DRQ55_02990 [Planctomycetota bacterium]
MTHIAEERAPLAVATDQAQPFGSLGWVVSLPEGWDRIRLSDQEQLVLLEDDLHLGPANAVHRDISDMGFGSFSVWNDSLYFSTSDGSDPRDGAHRYALVPGPDPRISMALERLPDSTSARSAEQVADCLRVVLEAGQLEPLEEVERHTGVRGKDVLEVGCGQCWSAPFFLGAGARSYHGIELIGPLDEARVFDRSHAQQSWTDDHYLRTPLALPEFLEAYEGIRYTNADFGATRLPSGCADVVFLRVVSEHLLEPRKCFTEMHRLLRPGGKLYLSHGSYQAWNGHHVVPHNLTEHDPHDPRQAEVVDWRHLETLVENDRTDGHNLNYIRFHELVGLLGSLFDVSDWSLLPTPPETGGERLSDARRAALPEYYREELLSDMSYIVCQKTQDLPLSAPPAAGGAGVTLSDLLGEHGQRLLAAWVRDGGDTLAVSRATGIAPWQLVELRERVSSKPG